VHQELPDDDPYYADNRQIKRTLPHMPPDEDERIAREWAKLEEQPITGTEPRIRVSKSGFKTIELERRIPTGIDPAKFGGIGGIGVGFEETEGGLRKVSATRAPLGLVLRDGIPPGDRDSCFNLLGRLRAAHPKP
jgi:hypothetical protein